MTQMAFVLYVSLHPFLSPSLSLGPPLSLSGFAAVATELKMRGGGRSGSREECEGDSDGTGKREIRKSEPTACVKWSCVTAAVVPHICVGFLSSNERQKQKECFCLDLLIVPDFKVCVLHDCNRFPSQ